jgi:hypothetical protein
MARKYPDPEAPEVLEAVLERMRRMTREDWIKELAWRPEGVEETWRMQRLPEGERVKSAKPRPRKPVAR